MSEQIITALSEVLNALDALKESAALYAVSGKLAITTHELQKITGLGKVAAIDLGNAAGAGIKVGNKFIWNVAKIKAYLDRITGEEVHGRPRKKDSNVENEEE